MVSISRDPPTLISPSQSPGESASSTQSKENADSLAHPISLALPRSRSNLAPAPNFNLSLENVAAKLAQRRRALMSPPQGSATEPISTVSPAFSPTSTTSTQKLAEKRFSLNLPSKKGADSPANSINTVSPVPSPTSAISISADKWMQYNGQLRMKLFESVGRDLFEVKYSIDGKILGSDAESENLKKLSSRIKSVLLSWPKPSEKAIKSWFESIPISGKLSYKKAAKRALKSHLKAIKSNKKADLPKNFGEKLEEIQKIIADSPSSWAAVIKRDSYLGKKIPYLVRLHRLLLEESANSTQTPARN